MHRADISRYVSLLLGEHVTRKLLFIAWLEAIFRRTLRFEFDGGTLSAKAICPALPFLTSLPGSDILLSRVTVPMQHLIVSSITQPVMFPSRDVPSWGLRYSSKPLLQCHVSRDPGSAEESNLGSICLHWGSIGSNSQCSHLAAPRLALRQVVD